jgi:hypothetical protein
MDEKYYPSHPSLLPPGEKEYTLSLEGRGWVRVI